MQRRIVRAQTAADLAREASSLKAEGLTRQQIARQLGKDVSYVNNLLRLDRLQGKALSAFREGKLSVMEAIRIAKEPDATAQERALAGPPRQRPVPRGQISALLHKVQGANQPKEWRRGATDALRCVLGEVTSEEISGL